MISGFRTFVADLRASAQFWTKAPLLPIMSLAVALLPTLLVILFALGSNHPLHCLISPGSSATCRDPELRSAQGFAGLVILGSEILLLGWVGVQRIWYLRLFREKQLQPIDAARLIFKFTPRYFRLALIVVVPSVVVGLVLVRLGLEVRWFNLVIFVLIDIFLTFVTTALAFSTRRAIEAISIGLKTIRRGWPGSVWYLLLPPLALQLLLRTSPSREGVLRLLLLWAFSTLVNLWFKGANAAFYLRLYEVDDDGAAYRRGYN